MSSRAMKMDNRHLYSWPIKPKDYNRDSISIWGAVIIDWQWAINTLVWKIYHE